MEPIAQYVIPLDPRSKKNAHRISGCGKRCPVCGKYAKQFIQVLKIYETEKIFAEHGLPVGAVDTDQKTYFRIAVKDGFVNLLSLQLAGKKRMQVGDFLRGYRHVEDSKVI